MKVNELMVGDWVQGNPCGQHCDRNNNTYYKIAVLDIGNHCLGYSVCGAVVELKYDDIFPIPLTKEILEKNGFSHNEIWHNSYVDIENYHIDVQFGYGGKVDNIRIRENGKDSVIPSEKTNLYLAHIEYLHELQHAMKLCGIEKEIEL